jgi:hypothetical protein
MMRNSSNSLFLVLLIVLLGFVACSKPANNKLDVSQITESEVYAVQQAWGEGIVNIGKVYADSGDFRAAAQAHIEKFYNYGAGSVLFKPTLAAENQFRFDFASALSYFVGGDENFKEDHGFAIKPWVNVRWESAGVKIIDGVALAMGNYYFMPENSNLEVKVEYSFAYIKDSVGSLRIVLHDSHVPYVANK